VTSVFLAGGLLSASFTNSIAAGHFRGATTASGIHETYAPGHASEVAWYLPDEAAEEF
jgi:hypothetical protein